MSFVCSAITKQSVINACGRALEAVAEAKPARFIFNVVSAMNHQWIKDLLVMQTETNGCLSNSMQDFVFN